LATDRGGSLALPAIQLGLRGGVLVANPIPAGDEISAAEMAQHIERALEEATRAGVSGKAVTPFLLARVLETTGGRSLATNIALVRNNAALAAWIAVALCRARLHADLTRIESRSA
jgi:pseudouridine-5'-phosphate glycosidase